MSFPPGAKDSKQDLEEVEESSGLSTSMPLSSRELWFLPVSPLSQTFRCPITHASCPDHPTLGPFTIFSGTEVPFLMLEIKGRRFERNIGRDPLPNNCTHKITSSNKRGHAHTLEVCATV